MVDHSVVDVDFSEEILFTPRLVMGCLHPQSFNEMLAERSYSRRYTGRIYPRSEWPDLIRTIEEANAWPYRRIVHPYDQGSEGTCTYNALALAKQIVFNRQEGDHNAIPLSPISGYRWNAPSPRTGSTVGGAIRWAESAGLLPTNEYEGNLARKAAGDFNHVHPSTGYYTGFDNNWRETSRLFRSDEWEWVGSVEEWISAIIDGHVCVGGRDGHAVCHCGLAWDDEIYSIYCNSWGPWGATLETAHGPLRSFGYDTEAKIRTMVKWDGWVLRTEHRPSFLAA